MSKDIKEIRPPSRFEGMSKEQILDYENNKLAIALYGAIKKQESLQEEKEDLEKRVKELENLLKTPAEEE